MKLCITEIKDKLWAAALVLGFWYLMSCKYSPLVVPPVEMVGKRLVEILTSVSLWKEIFSTVFRLLEGLFLGVFIGAAAGLIGGLWKPFGKVYRPILNLVQVVPPISWLILAIIWFGYNGRASIFIVVLSVVPPISICIFDGIKGIDKGLLEMGDVFCFSRRKALWYILIPSIAPYFFSGLKIAAGTACKTVVMGEVLTTTSGIGGQIMTARLNIEPESVIAWTVVLVGIYYGGLLAGRLLLSLLKKLTGRSLYAGYQEAQKRI